MHYCTYCAITLLHLINYYNYCGYRPTGHWLWLLNPGHQPLVNGKWCIYIAPLSKILYRDVHDIHPFTHTFIHRWQRKPYKAPAHKEQLGVQGLAEGLFNSNSGGPQDQTGRWLPATGLWLPAIPVTGPWPLATGYRSPATAFAPALSPVNSGVAT